MDLLYPVKKVLPGFVRSKVEQTNDFGAKVAKKTLNLKDIFQMIKKPFTENE